MFAEVFKAIYLYKRDQILSSLTEFLQQAFTNCTWTNLSYHEKVAITTSWLIWDLYTIVLLPDLRIVL